MKKYTIKKNPPKNTCKIWGCKNDKYKARGLCGSHHDWLYKSGQLEKYADPTKRIFFADSRYGIRRKIKNGVCRMIENNQFCNKTVHYRGLCTRHCSLFRLHKVFEKYAGPRKQTLGGPFQKKKRMQVGVCHLIDGGIRCHKPSRRQGLCGAHAKYLDQRGLLDKYGIFGRNQRNI